MSLDADRVTGTLMFRFLKRDAIALGKQSSLGRQANCIFDPREPNCLHSGFRTMAPYSCRNRRRQAKRT